MFTQKPSSTSTKHGDIVTFLLLTALFVISGILLSRYISFAVPLVIMLVLSTLPLFVARLLSIQRQPVLVPVPVKCVREDSLPNVEWKQIVGKDGEIVDVGYIKKRRTDLGA